MQNPGVGMQSVSRWRNEEKRGKFAGMRKSMNKKWYNLPRITAVFLVIISLFSIIYFYQHAPARASDIGNATFRPEGSTQLVLNGNQFDCFNADDDARTLTCSVQLEGQTLAMALTTTQGTGSTITRCDATFGGRSVACRGDYSMRYRGPIVVIEDALGISPERFSQLRQIHWLDQLSESTWLRLTTIFGLLLALNTAMLLWQVLSDREIRVQWRTAVTVIGTFSFFLFLRLSSTILLLFQGWID